MRFQKINDKAFKCIISQEEMDEQGMHIDDLMDDRNKAETFLRYVMQQARYELDFESSGEALNVQMSIMPCGDVQLMISDDKNAAIRGMLSELKNQLKDFTGTLEEKKKELRQLKEKSAEIPVKDENPDEILDMDLWAELASIEDGVALSRALPQLQDVDSTLYKLGDTYYLVMGLSMTRRQLAGIAFGVAEYSKTLYADNPGSYEIEEHGKKVIAKNAMATLAQL